MSAEERRLRKGLREYAAYWTACMKKEPANIEAGSDANAARLFLVEELGIWRNHGLVALSLLMDGTSVTP